MMNNTFILLLSAAGGCLPPEVAFWAFFILQV